MTELLREFLSFMQSALPQNGMHAKEIRFDNTFRLGSVSYRVTAYLSLVENLELLLLSQT